MQLLNLVDQGGDFIRLGSVPEVAANRTHHGGGHSSPAAHPACDGYRGGDSDQYSRLRTISPSGLTVAKSIEGQFNTGSQGIVSGRIAQTIAMAARAPIGRG